MPMVSLGICGFFSENNRKSKPKRVFEASQWIDRTHPETASLKKRRCVYPESSRPFIPIVWFFVVNFIFKSQLQNQMPYYVDLIDFSFQGCHNSGIHHLDLHKSQTRWRGSRTPTERAPWNCRATSPLDLHPKWWHKMWHRSKALT